MRGVYWAFPLNCLLRPTHTTNLNKINELNGKKNPENSLDMA